MTLTSTSGPAGGWKAFYADLATEAGLPAAAPPVISDARVSTGAMHVDLSEVLSAASGRLPPVVSIYADVLTIPADFSFTLRDSALVIKARRIEAGPDARFGLDYRRASGARLMVFCAELAGTLQINAVTSVNGATQITQFPLSAPPAAGGMTVTLAGEPVLVPTGWAQGVPVSMPEAFSDHLVSEFIYASLLYDRHPALALSMLNWTKSWAAACPELAPLCLRSTSLAALLSSQICARANRTTFVPYLSKEIYTNLAKSYVAQAKDFEDNLKALKTQKAVGDSAIRLGRVLLANQALQSEYTGRLVENGLNNYTAAKNALDKAQKNLNDATREVADTRINFERIGIPRWERQKIAEAVVGLVKVTIDFAAAIAETAGTGGAAAPGAAGAAAKGAAAIADTAKTAVTLAALAKQTSASMSKIEKGIKTVKAVFELSEGVVATVQDIKSVQSAVARIQNIDMSAGDMDVSSDAEWRIFQQAAAQAMSEPIHEKIEYAEELKVAIDAVAIHGQAVTAAQVAVVQAGQAYARAKLQRALADAQQLQLQAHVDALEADQQPGDAMIRLFYMRYIDIKSSLFLAIEHYRASYFYWALRESTTAPRIIAPMAELEAGLKDLTAIALDDATALDSFLSPPQAMKQQVAIDDAAVLAAFKVAKRVDVSLPITDPALRSMGRVRLDAVRIWLEGVAIGGDSASVSLSITTSGVYRDRLGGTEYQFTAKPLGRAFKYRITRRDTGGNPRKFDDGTYGYTEIDGALDGEVSYAYFKPTAFTQWRIALMDDGRGLDLSGLKAIVIEFAGSAIVPDAVASVAPAAA